MQFKPVVSVCKHSPRLKYAFLVSAYLLLTSCVSSVTSPVFINTALVSAAEKVTDEPLPIHVKESLSRYLNRTSPAYFFVANDGGHTLGLGCVQDYCDYDGGEEYRKGKQRCQKLRLGMDCTLLYLRKQPVTSHIKFKSDLTYRLLSGDISIPPEKALGKIIYMPGFSGWSSKNYNFPPAILDDGISPLLGQLEEYGWDVDILNIMHLDRTYLSKHPYLYKNLLSKIISETREKGYQRVILYGGSRGGAEIMHSVQAGIKPDAIALMEPDWHGPKYNSRGEFNDNHRTRSSKITNLLSEQKVDRIVFSFFKDSQWYSDISRTEIEQTLRKTGNNYFLIATPIGLEGHGGSWTKRFSNIYARCLSQFFLGEINLESECSHPDIDNSSYANWATKKPIIENGYKLLSGNEILPYVNKKALCPYNPVRDTTSRYRCLIWDEEGIRKSFLNEFGQLILTNSIIDFGPSGYCRHNGLDSPTYRCSGVYVVEDNLLALAPDKRNSFSWFRLIEKARVENLFKKADFYCKNPDKLESVNCEAL